MKARKTTDVELLPVLKAAREIITSADRWCQDHIARDAEGNPVASDMPEAASFCFIGAVHKAARASGYDAMYNCSDDLEQLLIGCVPARFVKNYVDNDMQVFQCVPVARFNDDSSTTHDQVLGALDCVIGKLEAAK